MEAHSAIELCSSHVAAAFVISGFVVLAIRENPLEAVQILITGALGDLEGIGYTLYYATSFIFTGLAVAICFHAGLFNIGVDGQAYIAGLGAALVALHFGFLPGYTLAIAAIIGAAFGAAFAAIPGYLQAYRDSHIVITTIMFNYIASAIMGYLLVNVLRKPGQMNAETTPFRDTALVPQFHEVLAHFGVIWPVTPFNLLFLLALLCCFAVWLLIWRTRLAMDFELSSPTDGRDLRRHFSGLASRSSPRCCRALLPAASRPTSSWVISTGSFSITPPASASSASPWR